MASPQLGLGASLGSDKRRADRDQKRCASLGALHLGGLHVYCKYMHKHARAPRESVLTVSQRSCGEVTLRPCGFADQAKEHQCVGAKYPKSRGSNHFGCRTGIVAICRFCLREQLACNPINQTPQSRFGVKNRTRGMLPGFVYPYKLVNSDLSHGMHAASGGLLLLS